MRASPTLGIIWNDNMQDFSQPSKNGSNGNQHEANSIAPGKRPMSSMSPLIIYSKKTGKVKFITFRDDI